MRGMLPPPWDNGQQQRVDMRAGQVLGCTVLANPSAGCKPRLFGAILKKGSEVIICDLTGQAVGGFLEGVAEPGVDALADVQIHAREHELRNVFEDLSPLIAPQFVSLRTRSNMLPFGKGRTHTHTHVNLPIKRKRQGEWMARV